MSFEQSRFLATWQATVDLMPGETGRAIAVPTPNLQVYDCLESTNQTLWQLIDQGTKIGTAVLALQQKSGRGQWGRRWESPVGGLYLSVAIAPQLPLDQQAQLTLSSAWGITTLLRQLEIPVQLKWPNDLILQGRKLGGILTETRIQQGQIAWAVVGVGINWANPVPETGISLQSWVGTHHRLQGLEDLVALTLRGIWAGYHQWRRRGIPAMLPDYQKLMAHVGQTVWVENRPAIVVGISEGGELRLRWAESPSETEPQTGQDEANLSSSEFLLRPGTISLGYSTSLHSS